MCCPLQRAARGRCPYASPPRHASAFGSLVEVGLFKISHHVLVSGEYLRAQRLLALPSGCVARTIDRIVVV